MYPAQTIADIYNACLPGPLQGSQLDETDGLYVKTGQVRNQQDVVKLLRRRFRNAPPETFLKYLLCGHKGSGKSTELNKFAQEAAQDYLVMNVSATRDLNPGTVSVQQLFTFVMRSLFQEADQRQLRIPQSLITQINDWPVVRRYKEAQVRSGAFEAELKAEAEWGIPLLAKLFVKVAAGLKLAATHEQTAERTHDPELPRLVELCNDLIAEVRIALQQARHSPQGSQTQPGELLFVFEDLDKLEIPLAEKLFGDYGPHLAALQAHCIYTFPIVLHYNAHLKRYATPFHEEIMLPMVKTQHRNGSPNTEGQDLLAQIVHRRVATHLFKNPHDTLGEMIRKSGGCLTDLLRMVREAATYAEDQGDTSIHPQHVQRAIQALQNDYRAAIADKGAADGHPPITAKEYWDALARIANQPAQHPDNTRIVLDLRHNLSVLEYNGEQWCAVHPLVRDLLADRGSLA